MSLGELYFAAQAQAAARGQIAENSGRAAEAFIRFRTEGWGNVAGDDPIMFPSPFTGQPAVQYGFVVLSPPDPQFWQEPQSYGGVGRWKTQPDPIPNNEPPGGVFFKGFYAFATVQVVPQPLVGDFTAAQVRAYRQILAANPPVVTVEHHFSFRGEAFKELPAHVGSALAERPDLDSALNL